MEISCRVDGGDIQCGQTSCLVEGRLTALDITETHADPAHKLIENIAGRRIHCPQLVLLAIASVVTPPLHFFRMSAATSRICFGFCPPLLDKIEHRSNLKSMHTPLHLQMRESPNVSGWQIDYSYPFQFPVTEIPRSPVDVGPVAHWKRLRVGAKNRASGAQAFHTQPHIGVALPEASLTTLGNAYVAECLL